MSSKMNEVDFKSALNAGDYHPDGTSSSCDIFNLFEEICSIFQL